MSTSKGDRATGHERIDYDFNFKLFDYDEPLNYQPCIKLQFFFSKLPEVSYEHFFQHYGHVHSDMTVAAKHFGAQQVQRYTQQHQTPEMKEKVKSVPGMQLLDYDGCSTLWFKTWDNAEAFFTSPHFAALADDCNNFMDTSAGIKMLAGHEMICYGKAIPDVDAKDGITKYKST